MAVNHWDPTNHYKEVEIAEKYDAVRFSSIAGKVFNRLEKNTVRAAFVGIAPATRILDVPCGTGRLAEELLESGFQVQGVDISAAMLEVAAKKLARFGDNFLITVSDVRDLAKTSAKKYDAALCARVLMHFPLDEQISFLKSVAALTKGRVVFTQCYSSPYQRFRRKIKAMLGHQPPATHPITEAELQTLLKGAGLKELRRHRFVPLISEAIIVVAVPI